MATVTFPKPSPTPGQNVDTPQEIGRTKFVPKGKGGVGHGSGHLETKPPTKKHVTLSTDKHHAQMRKDWASGGGSKQVSFTAPKSRTKFGTEKSHGKDQFVPKSKSSYGTGGV